MENLCNRYTRYNCSVTVVLLSTLKVAVPMGSRLACNIPTGSPTSSSSSSLCFNEAPGRFWKALELNAVHPVQTTASSSVPASLDQTLLCLLPRHHGNCKQDGGNRVLLKTGPMISTDVTTHRQHRKMLGSGQFLA